MFSSTTYRRIMAIAVTGLAAAADLFLAAAWTVRWAGRR
jgi:hypothetical protein